VTCLPPSIITLYTKALLCYHWLSFRSCVHTLCIRSLSDFILFCCLFAFVFSLGCVFLYFHLPCTFDGCFLFLIFIYRVFLLYTKTLTYTNIPNLILVPSSIYTYVDS
jgi:hypothetical protein